MTWRDVAEPEARPPGIMGWVRVILRGVPLGLLVFGGLLVLLLVRLIERPIFKMQRPITPVISRNVCRWSLVLLGVRFSARGAPMAEKGAVVANHSSWLDIFALHATQDVYFVSKSEVAGWPGIGWLARATGTVFIRRDPKEAAKQKTIFEDRLQAGHKLLFFPEGTSSDGRQVLPFKSTLFAAFFTEELRDICHIQPVTLTYHAPEAEDDRFYGWWGDMEFGPHLLQTLAAPRQGRIELEYHAPLKVADFAQRKSLAAASEAAVRAGLSLEAPPTP